MPHLPLSERLTQSNGGRQSSLIMIQSEDEFLDSSRLKGCQLLSQLGLVRHRIEDDIPGIIPIGELGIGQS